MRLPLILLTNVVCLVSFVIAEESTPSSIADLLIKNPNPLIILKVMPKVIEKLRERLPQTNLEAMIPTVLREIQESVHLPQFNGLDSGAVPTLITTIIERVLQRFQSNTQSSPSVPDNNEQDTIELQTQKAEIRSTEKEVLLPKTELPDLAFDRDPSRNIPRKETDDDDDEELGIEPDNKTDNHPQSLGEYDQFYSNRAGQ